MVLFQLFIKKNTTIIFRGYCFIFNILTFQCLYFNSFASLAICTAKQNDLFETAYSKCTEIGITTRSFKNESISKRENVELVISSYRSI